jgi:hypothetical protein
VARELSISLLRVRGRALWLVLSTPLVLLLLVLWLLGFLWVLWLRVLWLLASWVLRSSGR